MQLFSERLTFRKYISTDFPAYFELAGDERVMKMITGKGLTEEETRARFQKALDINTAHTGYGSFIVQAKENDLHIGSCKLVPTVPGEAEVGYMLLPENWGKGYGTEILNCLIQYAGKLPELHALTAIIDPANAVSRRILEKAGFTSERVCEMGGLPAEILRKAIS